MKTLLAVILSIYLTADGKTVMVKDSSDMTFIKVPAVGEWTPRNDRVFVDGYVRFDSFNGGILTRWDSDTAVLDYMFGPKIKMVLKEPNPEVRKFIRDYINEAINH